MTFMLHGRESGWLEFHVGKGAQALLQGHFSFSHI